MDKKEIYKIIDSKLISPMQEIQNRLEDRTSSLLKMIDEAKDITDYKLAISELEGAEKYVNSINVNIRREDVTNLLDVTIRGLTIDRVDKINSELEAIIKRIEERRRVIIEEIRNKNDKVKERQAFFDTNMKEILNKRVELQSVSEPYLLMCEEENIHFTENSLDFSSFLIPDVKGLYDKYIGIAKNKTSKVISDEIKKYGSNAYLKLGLILVTTIVMVTPIAGIVAILFYLNAIKRMLSYEKELKLATVICTLAYSVDMTTLLDTDKSGEDFETEQIDVDTDPRFADLIAEAEAKDKEREEVKNDEEIIEARKIIDNSFEMWYSALVNEEQTISRIRSKKLSEISQLKGLAESRIQEIKDNLVLLSKRVSDSYVMDMEFAIGYDDESGEEVYEDFSDSSIIINGDIGEETTRNLVRILVLNFLSNVAAELVNVHIFDKLYFSSWIKELDDGSKLKSVLAFYRDKLDDLVNKAKACADENIMLRKGFDTFSDMNREREENDKKPGVYQVFVIASDGYEFLQKNDNLKFLDWCFDNGVYFIVVDNMSSHKDKPIAVNASTTKVLNPSNYTGVNTYNVNSEMLFSMSNTLITAIENKKISVLDWHVLMDKYVPEDKIWTFSSSEKILLTTTVLDGDVNELVQVGLGSVPPVHGMVAGTTGAGKSAFLNQEIATLVRMYSPDDLELILVDFKCVEFSSYINTPEHPFTLPHLRACLCTTDPDFAISLLTALNGEVAERYNRLAEAGVKNSHQYNQKMELNGTPELKMSRVVVIIDECSVIPSEAEQEGKELFKKFCNYQGKIARAAGYHVILCSQNVSGLMNQDDLGFYEFRVALRSTAESSKTMLGNDMAYKIKEKLGWGYTISKLGEDLSNLRLGKVPYLDDSPDKSHPQRYSKLHQHIQKLYNKAKDEGYKQKDVIFYNEEQKHSFNELKDYYKKYVQGYVDKNPEEVILLFGEPMQYTTNRAPVNVKFGRIPNTHICVSSFTQNELVQLYKTIRYCVDNSSALSYINCQDVDLRYLFDVEEDFTEEYDWYYTSKECSTTEFFKVMEAIMMARMGQEDVKFVPLFFFLVGWDKAVGFGIDFDNDLNSRWQILMSKATSVNIHLVFMDVKTIKIRDSILDYCGAKITTKTDEDSSRKILKTKLATKSLKIPDGYGFLNSNNEIQKFKIYQYEVTKTITKNIFVQDSRV